MRLQRGESILGIFLRPPPDTLRSTTRDLSRAVEIAPLARPSATMDARQQRRLIQRRMWVYVRDQALAPLNRLYYAATECINRQFTCNQYIDTRTSAPTISDDEE